MDTDAKTSTVGLPGERSDFSRIKRHGVVVATLVGLALAMATPGLAADDVVPIPEVALPPDAATDTPLLSPADSAGASATESEPLPPAPAESPVTVSVDADADNIDVSVRVLSPGTDAQESVEPTVVSDSEALDITAPSPPASELSGDSITDLLPGSNTNVTVRVLSPGDNGSVAQSSPREPEPPGIESAESPVEEGRDARETSGAAVGENVPEAADGSSASPTDASSSPNQSAQYQDVDSRYQSDSQFEGDTWQWAWNLSLDCDGNATSTQSDTGSISSREWEWTWSWEWACGAPPHPPPIDSLEAGIDNELMATDGPESTPTSTASPSGGDASAADTAEAPWLWTWKFTFCGETVTVALPIDTTTALQWTWEWLWTWTCQAATMPEAPELPAPSAIPPSPVFSTAESGVPDDDVTGGTTTASVPVELPNLWIVPVELPTWVLTLVPPDHSGALVPASNPSAVAISAPTLVDIAGIGVSLAPATVISPGRRELRGHTAHVTTLQVTNGWRSERAEQSVSDSARPRIEKAATRAKPPRDRSGDAPLPRWPPLRPMQAAGASGASSGFVPSASVFGTAALVALFVLAAPGSGRRVPVARELRPRGTDGSSIDHPG